ncbi:hypothetical protein VV02_06870 [Luteipulveratus mongoliensis]|uniref:Aminopeptidase N n=1 Tax=Luteipulveratus mongoliensis TaxID=571913 RepID=A0A0K1JPS7_9MICO|nr:hypothetical protein VV02_06870 [Luteipulveratus mongoliensis]
MVCSALALAVIAGGSIGVQPAAHAASDEPSPGSSGLGDPLFPLLGNGGYDALHYALTFDYAPSTRTFAAASVMTARATQSLSRFNLDFDGHTLRSVKVNGRMATWVRDGGELVITPGRPLHRGEKFTVETAYDGTPTDPYVGLTGWVLAPDGGFASAVQASRADTFLPVNDHPSDKATWSLHVGAPKGFVGVGNGILDSVRPRADGGNVWSFTEREPMASELLGVSVTSGTYLRAKGPHNLPLRHVVPVGQEATYAPVVAQTSRQIAWAEKRFGRYPFSTYGVHIFPGYRDALENQTMSLFGPNWFTNASTSTSYTNVMVHELVHQWFGDSVTPATWQDAWLNEGPAVFYAALWDEEEGRSTLEGKMRTAYTKLDAVRKTDGPPGKPHGLGGFNIYDGGAVVLYAVRQQIGTTAFDRVMRTWVQKHRHDNASTEDFIEHVTTVAPQPGLDAFLRDWLYGLSNPAMPGHPEWSQS